MVKEKETIITAESGKQDLLIIREFNAPRELVFQAWIDPNLYVQWFAADELSTTIQRFEPHSGGSWKYVQKNKLGESHSFHGVFHDVTFPEQIIQTFGEGLPKKGQVAMEVVRFEDLADDKTRLTLRTVFQSVEDRDRMLQAGIEQEVQNSYERLDDVLARELSKG